LRDGVVTVLPHYPPFGGHSAKLKNFVNNDAVGSIIATECLNSADSGYFVRRVFGIAALAFNAVVVEYDGVSIHWIAFPRCALSWVLKFDADILPKTAILGYPAKFPVFTPTNDNNPRFCYCDPNSA